MQEHNVQETQERQEPEEVQVPLPKVGFVLAAPRIRSTVSR